MKQWAVCTDYTDAINTCDHKLIIITITIFILNLKINVTTFDRLEHKLEKKREERSYGKK